MILKPSRGSGERIANQLGEVSNIETLVLLDLETLGGVVTKINPRNKTLQM